MNKIKSLFKGSSIAMIAVGLLVAGVASAALVNYLSNAVKATTTVESPITMSVNTGVNADESDNTLLEIGITYGADDFTFTTVAKNNANNPVNGYPVIVIKETDGGKLTGEEITKVLFRDKNYNEWNGLIGNTALDITNLLYVVHSDGSLEKLSNRDWDHEKLVLFFDNDGNGTAQPYPIEAGEVNWNALTLTWNQATVGTYEIYSQYADNLADYASAQYK